MHQIVQDVLGQADFILRDTMRHAHADHVCHRQALFVIPLVWRVLARTLRPSSYTRVGFLGHGHPRLASERHGASEASQSNAMLSTGKRNLTRAWASRPSWHLIVHVHEATLHLLQAFNLVLKHDAHIVGLCERCFGLHDNLDLHQEPRPKVVGAHDVEGSGRVVRLATCITRSEWVWNEDVESCGGTTYLVALRAVRRPQPSRALDRESRGQPTCR